MIKSMNCQLYVVKFSEFLAHFLISEVILSVLTEIVYRMINFKFRRKCYKHSEIIVALLRVVIINYILIWILTSGVILFQQYNMK